MTDARVSYMMLSPMEIAAFLSSFVALAIAYLSWSILAMDYVHVLLDAIWTEADVVHGLPFAVDPQI